MRLGWLVWWFAACSSEPAVDPEPAEQLVETASLEALLLAALPEAPRGIDGISLLVFDAEDRRIVDLTVGDFSPDRRVPVASASKLVSGLVLLRLVHEGVLSMEDTPAEVLGWTGTSAGAASLDQLGAFVSGLRSGAACNYVARTTLQDCAQAISELDVEAAPGEVFTYGPSHLTVAAAMAEVASGSSWAELFREELARPLGLDASDLRYVTHPKWQTGDDNPLVAGGLIATAEEYARILSVLFHQGEVDGEVWIDPQLIARMGSNAYTTAAQVSTPMDSYNLDFRYSWSSWLNCEGAPASCPVISSPGAYGLSPWVDLEHGYYAVLAMESDGLGGALMSVQLMEALRPEIEGLRPTE